MDAGFNLHDRNHNLMAISNELNKVFFQYLFRLVPILLYIIVVTIFPVLKRDN